MSHTTFDRLGLPAELVAALATQRITEPFAIQASTVPDALAGRDILGRAPTGSGKTLAFGLPALSRLAATDRAAKRRPRGLILSPTRELAEQIKTELEPLAAAVDRRVTAVYGGAALSRQVKVLGRGVDLLVACPGRLLDLIDQGEVALDQVEIAVVDEADRMADMGFLPDVRRLLDQTAPDRQTLLFSATLDRDVQQLTDRYQHDPALHEVGDPEPDLSTVDHRFIKVAKNRRLDLAADLISEAGSTVVFVRTRHGVDRLARQLKARGVTSGFLHGGRSQSQRTRALELFTNGKVDALVATDVAARGIHVDGVACVLHYDPPAEIKDYVHRSGRTARAGAGGTVISLLDPSQVKASQKMQQELGIQADLEPPPTAGSRPERAAEVGERATTNGARSTASGPKAATTTSRRGGPRRATTGKPRRTSGRAGRGGGNAAGSARSTNGSEPRTAKPGAGQQGQHGQDGQDGKQGTASTSGAGKPGARKPGTDKPGAKKPKIRQGAKKRGSSGSGATSKRSGRPRPPNRKGGRPKTRRRS